LGEEREAFCKQMASRVCGAGCRLAWIRYVVSWGMLNINLPEIKYIGSGRLHKLLDEMASLETWTRTNMNIQVGNATGIPAEVIVRDIWRRAVDL
jgi:hypothetical protein